MTKFIIKDWIDNLCFGGKEFDSFEDAWGYLYEHPKYERLSDRAFDDAMSEYVVIKVSK